jgi:hypothetical protein
MTLFESIAVALIVLILGLKIYSTYRNSRQQTQTRLENNLAKGKIGDVEYDYSDLAIGEKIVESRLDWSEIFLIIVGLGVCAPFGLILLWKTDKLDSKTKNVITIAFMALVVGLAVVKLNSS